ncbi:zinc transporter 2 isoform X1 [Stigmatopora nigra]
MSMDVKASSSEKSQLIHDQNHKNYCERVHSSFLDPSEPFPLKNGGTVGGEVALQRAGDSHCHRHAALPAPGGDDANRDGVLAQKKLYLASAVCLVFMIGEIIGGYLAHSLAIMTDAAHLLTDLGSMLVSIFSLWISSRPPAKNMTFGWHRSEIMGAFISVLSIWMVTGVLVYLAIQRIIRDDYEIEGHVMLLTSAFAVVVNILMAYILHHSTTFHAHGHGYHPMGEEAQSPHGHALLGAAHGSTSVRAAFIHVVGDLLQSVGVMVAAIVIFFRPEYKVADPICTFLFSIFVLCTTFTILKDVFRILMEGSPKGIEFNSVKEVLLTVKAVRSAHSLHLWALTLGRTLASVHLAVDEGTDTQSVLQEATELLHTKFGFHSVTIQVEHYHNDMQNCTLCQDPWD